MSYENDLFYKQPSSQRDFQIKLHLKPHDQTTQNYTPVTLNKSHFNGYMSVCPYHYVNVENTEGHWKITGTFMYNYEDVRGWVDEYPYSATKKNFDSKKKYRLGVCANGTILPKDQILNLDNLNDFYGLYTSRRALYEPVVGIYTRLFNDQEYPEYLIIVYNKYSQTVIPSSSPHIQLFKGDKVNDYSYVLGEMWI
jgi:hypothetical protein